MRRIIFDLDNTIYPREVGLFSLVDNRINAYMRMKLGLDYDAIEILRLKYMDEYGTTLAGLMVYHNIDPDDYLSFVHDICVEDILSTNPELGSLFEQIVIDKVIFTNGSFSHALRVLNALGVTSYFSRIFDIRFMNYIAKPNILSYQRLLDALGVDATECLIVEDLAKNLYPAKELGMTTVLIGDEKCKDFDFIIDDIFGIDKVLKEIGQNE
ncbi:MAG: pyrimidine 5'-nucleotidase [Thermodesulfobacteriota bacterium]|nr:pyrimidine 5'-nucleotidase [Thermodesulfobacteriota bacterium]